MKKILTVAAICAGILAFANADFAEAADLQAQDVTSIQSSTYDTQQLSSRTDDKDPD